MQYGVLPLNLRKRSSHVAHWSILGVSGAIIRCATTSQWDPAKFTHLVNDFSFDTDLAPKWGCHGFAADPTVTHPFKLHPNVTFHSFGAKVRAASAFQILTSMPALRKWLGHSHVTVLKMDCEGYEYSLGEDIALEDPSFFTHVDQFAVEIHVSKNWLETQDALYSLGLLYYFLEEAGLKLQHAEILGCDPLKESIGCMDELTEMGDPCGLGKSCHNYLFAREDFRGNSREQTMSSKTSI
jgi:hypothetical protein